MGVWGRIGCGGLAAIKERQEERTSVLTPALSQCFEILLTILKKQPKRCLEVMPPPCGRFVAASDAALEMPRQGTGGFCIVWLDLGVQCREAFIASIPEKLYDVWTPGDRKIAQLEMLMVLMGLLSRASTFRGRRGVWYIDNQASLMSLMRGRPTDPDLERMSNLIHIILFALGTFGYTGNGFPENPIGLMRSVVMAAFAERFSDLQELFPCPVLVPTTGSCRQLSGVLMSALGIKMHWEKTGARSGGNLSGLKVVPACPGDRFNQSIILP